MGRWSACRGAVHRLVVSRRLRPARIGSLVRFRIQDVGTYEAEIQVKMEKRPKKRPAGRNTFDPRTPRQGLGGKAGSNGEPPELQNPS